MTKTRPLIGLSGRRKTGHHLASCPDALLHLEADWYYADYARAVFEAGGLPFHLPLDVDPALFVGRVDGIVLTGGADLAPQMYGDVVRSDTVEFETERDLYDSALYTAAFGAQLPMLGICRGLQMINVHCGGTLHQHVPEHAAYDRGTNGIEHSVTLAEGSTLGRLYGPTHEVNSLHHQTVHTVGEALRVTATAPDGTVEGIEHESLPIVGVQWHPEMLDSRADDPIFTWLVEAAAS